MFVCVQVHLEARVRMFSSIAFSLISQGSLTEPRTCLLDWNSLINTQRIHLHLLTGRVTVRRHACLTFMWMFQSWGLCDKCFTY